MSTVRANIFTDNAGGNTASFNGIPLRQGVFDPENRIINGAMQFWQRGTSHSSNGYGSTDRWSQTFNGGTVTMSRQSFALGETLDGNSPTFFLRQTVSGQSGSQLAYITQKIEDVRSYAGQTITILGWARRSSGSGNMTVRSVQDFGTGGSPSGFAGAGPQTVILTESWQSFAVTLTIPSITGKTLGTNGNDNLWIDFFTSGDVLGIQTISVDLWGIHIKRGTHTAAATALYKAPELGPELARCQRYYWRGLPALGINFASYASGALFSYGVPFPVTMRGTPTTAFDITGATLSSMSLTNFAAQTQHGARILFTTSAITQNASATFLSTNWFAADAEL